MVMKIQAIHSLKEAVELQEVEIEVDDMIEQIHMAEDEN